MKRSAAVVGVGEARSYKRGEAKDSEFLLACTAIRGAAEDAGLQVDELDGFVSYLDQRNDPVRLSAALGLRELRFTAQPWGGGGTAWPRLSQSPTQRWFWMDVSSERRVRRRPTGRPRDRRLARRRPRDRCPNRGRQRACTRDVEEIRRARARELACSDPARS